jgi:hypothetical protein
VLFPYRASHGHLTKSIRYEATRRCGFLLRASLVVVVGLCSLFVRLTQVTRLRFRHKTCRRKEQVCVPFTQSRNLLVVGRLGDMTFKLKRCYRTFEFKSHVGYSRTFYAILDAGLSVKGINARTLLV